MNLFEDVIRVHAKTYPCMEPCDAVKLCYQACFGAGHLLNDPEGARAALYAEYAAAEPHPDEELYEELPGGFSRLNLGAAKREGLPAELVFRLFAATASAIVSCDAPELFHTLIETAGELAKNATFGFSQAEFDAYAIPYLSKGEIPPPVSHSDAYRNAYSPHYRVVDARYKSLTALCKFIYNISAKKRTVAAFDGRCASGKTTAAELIARVFDAKVVHCDDFFLPPELRTEERYAELGGNIHYERFSEEVVAKLPSGEPFAYGVFDCAEQMITGYKFIGESPLIIVEGAYSTHPRFGLYYDLSVFFDVNSEIRRERIIERDGADAWQRFEQKWIPLEEAYIAATKADKRADMTVIV